MIALCRRTSSNYSLALRIEHNLDLAAKIFSAQVLLELGLNSAVVAVELSDFAVDDLLRLWIHNSDTLAKIVFGGLSVQNVVDGKD